MPKVATIPTEIEYDTGWAYAAIVNDEVVAIESLNVGEASEIANIDPDAFIETLMAQPAAKAAQEHDEATFAAYEESGYDDETVDYDAAALSVRIGMASGGEFTHTFSAREARAVGLPKNFG